MVLQILQTRTLFWVLLFSQHSSHTRTILTRAQSLQTQCGLPTWSPHWRNASGSSVARPAQYPWMAWLRGYIGETEYLCSGSLVSDRHVLTAAHCWTVHTTHMLVVLGVRHRFESPSSSTQVRRVDTWTHAHYERGTRRNDIAVIRLNATIDFTADVRPVCLPPRRPLTQLIGKWLKILGWGRRNTSSWVSSSVVKVGRELVVPLNACKNKFGRAQPPAPIIDESKLCVGNYETLEGACHGDSGGPAMLVDDAGVHTLVGIISFGTAGCGSDPPDVLTRVDHYLDFIAANTYE